MSNYSHLKQKLQDRKDKIEARLRESDHYGLSASASFSTGELSQYDNHPADTATETYERGKDIALHEHLEQELKDLDHALEKFKNGTYGICEVTGKQIPVERLEANPTARTVVEQSSGAISEHRPVEEEVLTGFDQFNFDNRDDETQFDAEDAYQSVASFNENSMIFEDASLDKTDELVGYVEELEGFVSTGIEGYQGDENVEFQRNIHYDRYLNDK
ncbi:TraR/DksA C4-type zinc finger protein [Bacillus sp. FJAT-45350]|uniref:TraR/DksA C4-type zinc finger protein n=1 Tax=Bacillus sp. FJAT-45350 TaxID=2011014 RepID=UPI000BB6CE78|nr:TraR/DksA C4-type zinc finger protein [Bacillus sp. FJAT-45350]